MIVENGQVLFTGLHSGTDSREECKVLLNKDIPGKENFKEGIYYKKKGKLRDGRKKDKVLFTGLRQRQKGT